MHNFKRISVVTAVLTAFLIAFSTLYIVLENNSSDLKKSEDEFYSKDFDSQNKIFILGSSQTGHLNATYINQYFSEHQKNYTVYNLSITGDRPQQRLATINKLISLKPVLIIYGVGFRDFQNDEFKTTDEFQSSTIQDFLPNPQQFIRKEIKLNLLTGYDFNFLQSPKGITLKILNGIFLPSNSTNELFFDNTPFFHTAPRINGINQLHLPAKINQENQDIRGSFTGMLPPQSNIDVLALEQIVTKLKDHHIKLVIFSTPYEKSYFNLLPQSNKQEFDSILLELSNQYDVKIYRLDHKYENFTGIWTDFNHIALDPKVTQFNNDIVKMILSEVN